MMRCMVCALALSGNSVEIAALSDVESTAKSTERAEWPDRLAISGALRFNYFRSSRDLDDETDFLGTTAEIKAVIDGSSETAGLLRVRAIEPDVTKDRVAGDAELIEGYITIRLPRADIVIGKQIVAWGRADSINPTDNLTPRDYTKLLPFEDDQRFGTAAIRLDTFLSDELTIATFATPLFEPSRIPLPEPLQDVPEDRPHRSLANSEVGVRLNRTGRDIDWSLSYYHGYSLLPSLQSDSTTPAVLRYDAIDVIGADIASNLRQFGLRAEAAFVNTNDKDGTAHDIKNPFFFAVAGVDRTFGDNLNVNFQLFGQWIRNFVPPEEVTDARTRINATQNAIMSNQLDRRTYGITSRIANTWWHRTLTTEVLLVFNLTRHDSFVRPLIRYAFSDRIAGAIGADVYRGAPDTFFGALHQNSTVFLELRYNF